MKKEKYSQPQPTPQEAIDKEVLLQAIEKTKWHIQYHKEDLAKLQELLKIYNNQLNQLN
jgi:hypothetical protein